MKRVAKITIICPIEIDDDVDVTNEDALFEAESEAVQDDLFGTEFLQKWCELDIEDIREWEE